MSTFIDTNVVVRYLTGTPPEMAARAHAIIDGADDLLVTDVVLAEAAWVLSSIYRVPRAEVVDHLVAIMRRQNIAPFRLDKAEVIQGLMLCRPSGRVSFADAMIWAAARSSGSGVVYSFDEHFPADGIQLRRSAGVDGSDASS